VQLADSRTEAKQQICAERINKCCECPLQQRGSLLRLCIFRYLQVSDIWVASYTVHCVKVKVKVKLAIEEATKAQKLSRVIPPLFL